jgi:hypothetical protein
MKPTASYLLGIALGVFLCILCTSRAPLWMIVSVGFIVGFIIPLEKPKNK